MTIIEHPATAGRPPARTEVLEAAEANGVDPAALADPNRPRTEIPQARPALLAGIGGTALAAASAGGFALGYLVPSRTFTIAALLVILAGLAVALGFILATLKPPAGGESR
ncbi:MAG: hypothetical protein ACRD2Z_09425 [Thermoanaerobaculia bacterium]